MKAVVLVAAVHLLTLASVSAETTTNVPLEWPTNGNTHNYTYVGCYSTTHPYSFQYMLRHSLPLEECVSFCDHRMTRYVGVQEEESPFPYHYPFCVNSLEEHFQEVNSSLCHPCAETPERYCGGHNTMSVYQLRDSISLAVLLATSTGVSMFSSDSSSVTAVTNYPSRVARVDLLYLEDKVVFVSGNDLWSSEYNPFEKNYVTPTRFTRHDGPNNLGGLAVDWVNMIIYYENYKIDDYNRYGGRDYYLLKIDPFTRHKEEVLKLTDAIEEIAVDPYNRLVFSVEKGTLHCYGLENKDRKTYENRKSHITYVVKLALDVNQEIIYLIGVDDFGAYALMKVGYEDSKTKRLYSGPHLTYPFGLDLSGDMIVWGNEHGGQYTLYTCQLTPRCRQEDVKQIYKQTEKIYDIKIYQPSNQMPNVTRLCSKLKCSHQCSAVSPYAVHCTCPEGMMVGADNNSCDDLNTTTSFNDTDTAQLKAASNTEPAVTSTMSVERLDPFQTNTEKIYVTPSSTILSNNVQLDQGYTETVTPGTSARTANTKDDFRRELKCPTRTLEICLMMGVVLLAALLLGVIYMYMKRKRSEEQLGLGFQASSEMEVLTNSSNI